ncbi:DUF1491 family protein [Novosphingopyxis sp.]|uniref:DUF1491 family protein n=1 Tax=Novosphingopyxis sp. TaxID=2709690 RepID=UPI003B597BFC
MIAPRVAAHVQIDAIRRLCEREGGFATVLAKGDRTAGDILIIYRERGGLPSLLRRALRWDGPPTWTEIERQTFENEQELNNSLAQRRHIDGDLWLIELDVPDAERFIAIMGEFV